jgi:hypothetical protein
MELEGKERILTDPCLQFLKFHHSLAHFQHSPNKSEIFLHFNSPDINKFDSNSVIYRELLNISLLSTQTAIRHAKSNEMENFPKPKSCVRD